MEETGATDQDMASPGQIRHQTCFPVEVYTWICASCRPKSIPDRVSTHGGHNVVSHDLRLGVICVGVRLGMCSQRRMFVRQHCHEGVGEGLTMCGSAVRPAAGCDGAVERRQSG